MNHLKEIKFLPNMSQSPLMVCLKDLGFVDMAQSIALQSPPPAGKIQLFIVVVVWLYSFKIGKFSHPTVGYRIVCKGMQ